MQCIFMHRNMLNFFLSFVYVINALYNSIDNNDILAWFLNNDVCNVWRTIIPYIKKYAYTRTIMFVRAIMSCSYVDFHTTYTESIARKCINIENHIQILFNRLFTSDRWTDVLSNEISMYKIGLTYFLV